MRNLKLHLKKPAIGNTCLREAGFSVIEIILAAAIFMIFSAGAISVILQGFDANRTGSEEAVANQYASEGLEAARSIKNQAYSSLVTTAGTGVGRSVSNVWYFTGTNNQFGPNNKYTRVITISAVQRDSSGNIVASGGTVDPNTMKITSTVTWNVTPARLDTVTQTTYLTNWGVPIITWFDPNYHYKKQITIDHTKVQGGADLSNFPVLISFIDPDLKQAPAGKVQNAGGFDIIFTDSTETTKLDHEIENYNPATGEVEMWVRIPTLSASTNTVIYLYFGNSSISTSQENKTGVWDANYTGVWHMGESSGNLGDSTSYGSSAIKFGAPTQGASGQIGNAVSFNGTTGNYFKVANPADGHLDFGTGSFTFGSWVLISSVPPLGNFYNYLYKGGPTNPSTGYTLYINDQPSIYGKISDGIAAQTNSGPHISTGTWYYFVTVVDRVAKKLYVYQNGTNTGSTDISSTGSVSDTNDLDFGSQSVGTNPIQGNVDEVEISNSARSAGWIGTEYNNQSAPSTFYSVGYLTSQ